MDVHEKIAAIQDEIAVKFHSLPSRDQMFEDAFSERDYNRLKELFEGKYANLVNLVHTMLDGFITHGVISKSDVFSDKFRNNGNEVFLKANSSKPETLLSGLHFYEIALSHAATSDRKAKAWGNISAAYYRMNFLPHTLKSIEYAMKHVGKWDVKLISKLQERKENCQRQIEASPSNADAGDPARLSYPSHQSVSGLAGVLKLGKESIVTEKSLKRGDIVAITKSFCFSIDFFSRQFCEQCGDRTSVKIPCDFCNCCVFCDESCKALAMEGFHAIECGKFSDFQPFMDCDVIKRFALKFAIKAMTIQCNNFEEETITCFDWKEGDENNDAMILKTILNMKETNLPFQQMFALVSYYVILMKRMKRNGRFQKFINGYENGEKRLFDMFLKAFLVIKRNGFHNDFTYNIDWLLGNFKHSCKPNVMIVRDSKLGTNNYVVIDDIAAGEQLTIAYG